MASPDASLVKRNFCTWGIKRHSSIKRKRQCDEAFCRFGCVYVRSFGCGAELPVVHMLSAHSVCLTPWMQLQLVFWVVFFWFFFGFMAIYFLIACTLTKKKSPELPLISCSIAPLGQNAWANIILKGCQENLIPLSSIETFGFWEWGWGCLFSCCSIAR